MSITAAPDTVLEDGRAVCIIRAGELRPGDIWVKPGRIDLTVTAVNDNPLKDGFVIVYYRIGGSVITGERGEVAMSFASILPRVETTQNGAH